MAGLVCLENMSPRRLSIDVDLFFGGVVAVWVRHVHTGILVWDVKQLPATAHVLAQDGQRPVPNKEQNVRIEVATCPQETAAAGAVQPIG